MAGWARSSRRLLDKDRYPALMRFHAGGVPRALPLLLAAVSSGCLLLFHDPDGTSSGTGTGGRGASGSLASGSSSGTTSVGGGGSAACTAALSPDGAPIAPLEATITGVGLEITDLDVDPLGRIVVVGSYRTLARMGGFPGLPACSPGPVCGFAALMDPDGTWVWAQRLTMGDTAFPRVGFSNSGIIVAGFFSTYFYPPEETATPPMGDVDGLVEELALRDGHIVNAFPMGGFGTSIALTALRVSRSGNVWVGGFAVEDQNSGDFTVEGSCSEFVPAPSSSADALVASFNASGCRTFETFPSLAKQLVSGIGIENNGDDSVTIVGGAQQGLDLPPLPHLDSPIENDFAAFVAHRQTEVGGWDKNDLFGNLLMSGGVSVTRDGSLIAASIEGAALPPFQPDSDPGPGFDLVLLGSTLAGPNRRFAGAGDELATSITRSDTAIGVSGTLAALGGNPYSYTLDHVSLTGTPERCGFVALANSDGEVCTAQRFCDSPDETKIPNLVIDRGTLVFPVNGEAGTKTVLRRIAFADLHPD